MFPAWLAFTPLTHNAFRLRPLLPPPPSSSSSSSYTPPAPRNLAVVPTLPSIHPPIPSPLRESPVYQRTPEYFVAKGDAVLASTLLNPSAQTDLTHDAYTRAGPRADVVFKSHQVHAAIVSVGGISPGINVIIKELTRTLQRQYGVRRISGIRQGFRGFYLDELMPYIDLDFTSIRNIHRQGGSALGMSRGGFDQELIVDAIEDSAINQLYIIGGCGAIEAASKIHEEIERRRLRTAVIVVPKTIDNDIPIVDRSFGFETAVEEAQNAIYSADTEARSFPNGLGVVKLMGRHSGFIAMDATTSAGCVDCCLIPEAEFDLTKVHTYLYQKIRTQGHALVVVSEGAGVSLTSSFQDNHLLSDIGLLLTSGFQTFFEGKGNPVNIKYIDPRYTIRAVPPNASDSNLCTLLAHAAVHGGMAGFTAMAVGPVNGKQAYLPLSLLRNRTSFVDIHGRNYSRMLVTTGQPFFEQ